MISLAFYWSLAFSQFFDVKRKDFWQMFLHHVATIMLLSFSWVCNLHRVGTLVLVIHDSADSLLDVRILLYYYMYTFAIDVIQQRLEKYEMNNNIYQMKLCLC